MATTLMDQAVACHERMLELADSDRPNAIQQALKGVKLFALLHQQNIPLPDWVPILEEQCCRYGAIWVHEWLRESDAILQHQDGHQWVSQALDCMDRLEQLHDSPLDWLAQMRDFLLQLPPAVAAQSIAVEVQRLVVIGNSQADSLRLALASAIPHAEIIGYPWESLTKPDNGARLQQLLANTDILVMQQLPSGYPDGIKIAIDGLPSLLPVGARVITVPNLHYEGHHPWIGYLQDADGQLAGLRGESPLGDYHDFLAMAAARRGLEVGDLLQRPAPPGLVEAIGQAHSQSLAELRRQEANCDLGLSDWIAHRYRPAAVMHSIDQPTQATVQQLLQRLLAQLTPTAQAPGLQLATDQALNQHQRPAISIPIHPWVRQSLQIEQWADGWGQEGGQAWTIHEQLASSIAFYRRYPWIGEANLGHPKHRFAEQCLDLLTPGAPAASPRAGAPTTAALINYFNDYDMLAAQLDTGCLDPYDRIYIWDGPYSYLLSISLFASVETRLDQTELGQRLLADPRVVYHYQKWSDEGEKRQEAYAAIKEDVVVLHDTDEFFRLDHQQLLRFWKSSYAVGSMLLQNLYAGGFYGSNSHYATNQLRNLPQKRVVFKRSAISPARHLDYCWLVGVEQHPTDETLVDQQPFGHAYHLTACRTPRGQAAKMSFYMALATKNQTNHPVADRLKQLAQDGFINLAQAQEIFLRGDPAYGGIPHPNFGLALLPRIIDPSFPETAIKALLAATTRVGPGHYPMLPRYPLYVWIEPQDANLSIKLKQAQPFTLKSWAWYQGQPAQAAEPLSSHTSCLELQLPQLPGLIGHLIELQVEGSDPDICLVDVAITSETDADAEANESPPSIPTASTEASPRAGAPTTAALINYFNDYDMLAGLLDTGCLDPYDRIYIWDGPYSYLLSISLFANAETRLDQTELGQRLLADPRVVYHYQKWSDEGEKRRDAYAATKEDVIVLHDTDEFFRLDHQQLLRFWKSSYSVGSLFMQNLYAGGLYGTDSFYATNELEKLPHKRIIFKRSAISPARHLDYCWLVLVEQQPTDETLVDQQPLGHAYHLTACRTPRGQAAKMSFYMALGAKNQTNHPVADRLQQLAQENSINLAQAQEILLRGNPVYGGIPNPDSGMALLPRIIDPSFPETAIKALLAATKRVGPGSYPMLIRYPLYVWIQPQDANLSIKFKQAQPLTLKCWAWCQGQPAQAAEPLSSHTSCLELQLPQLPGLIGHLIKLQVEGSDPDICLVDVAITSEPDADAEVNEALPSIPTAPTADTLFDCVWTADRPLAALEAFAERRLPQITTDAKALFEFCEAAIYSRNRRHLHLAWEALQRRSADELWTMIYSLRCCLIQDRGAAICSQLARNLLPHAAALDGPNRLLIAAVLAESYPPPEIGTLSALLAADHQAELTLHQLGHNPTSPPFAELQAKHHELLSGLNSLADEDSYLACLTYSACAPSLRRSFHDWASPSAIPTLELEGLLETIRRAVEAGQGFSLIRLGESEGIAINSDELGSQLMDAVRNADWVGIPDPSQTLQGPAFTWTVAANLAKNLSLNELLKIAPKIHPGGWLIHYALLDVGCFAAPPFNSVNGLITTMPPATGLQLPAKSLVINSANQVNPGTLSLEEHRQVLTWIEASVEPGELFLVNSGTHGPIHCQAIKARGAIAIDVGIVLELSSQDIPRQGVSRSNPQLAARADWAFRAAEALPPITPMLADGRAEEARELMESILHHQPLSVEALLRLAEIECHEQQWGKAMDLLCRANTLEPQNSRIGAALAELQLLLRERTPYGLGPDICLTTISTRLHTLEQVVRSLQRQTMPPRRIHIYLSQNPHLLDEGVDPQDARLQALNADSTVQLHWVENLGPYRKFALYLQNPANDSDDDRFITVDDDTIYPPRFIEYLATKHLRHQCVVAHRGRRMRLRPSRGFADYTNWHDGLHEPRLGNLPTGQSGVIYRRSYFPADLQLEAALRLAPTHDDLWLRWLTALQGVPALITQPNAAAKTAVLAFPMAEISSSYAKSSLWFAFNAPDAANRVTNDQAVQAIHNHFMTLGFDIEKLLRLEEEEQADFY
jgi:hypothetical protein